ncbi:MAG TPA: pitrilysin family protein [Candidatus Limnocylindria bacterium]
MDQPPVETHRLDNGLHVVLVPDDRVPVVSASLWYAVGSAHEQKGRSGFAHLFEHMMFQGSAHVAKGEHFGLVQAAGGRANAYTGLDATVYNDTVPSHELELVLWLEADRMATLADALTKEKLDNQRSVVQNERRKRVDNVPYGSWEERSHPLAFLPEHPYHHSAWGSMDELAAASLAEVCDFFTAHYLPNNAVLTLVGDLEPGRAVALVERHFGPIPAGSDPPGPPGRTDAVAEGGARTEVRGQGPLPRLYVACTVPAFGEDGYHAADLSVDLLATGRASRLQRTLVRGSQLAQAVEAWITELRLGASLILFEVTGRPGVAMGALEAAVDAELDRLAAEAPVAEELERVRTHRRARRAKLWEKARDRADRIGLYACLLGDPLPAFGERERDADIGPEQVVETARTWLARSRRSYLWYLP